MIWKCINNIWKNMKVKVTNLTYSIGGGKMSERYRKNQNRTFDFINDLTDEQILNTISHYGFAPTVTTKIIRDESNNNRN